MRSQEMTSRTNMKEPVTVDHGSLVAGTVNGLRPEAKDRVITLHSVRATDDVVAAVATHGVRGAVLHWFLGSPADINAAITADVYFSVNISMVRSRRGHSALSEMPPNRVLTETDAPFTRVEHQSVRPGQVGLIEQSLARLWSTDPLDIRRRLWSNLDALQGRLNSPLFPSGMESGCPRMDE